MGFFELVFGKVDVLAVVAFVFATLCVTWLMKKLLLRNPRIAYWLDDDFPKLMLSIAVGAGVFVALHFVLPDFPITQATELQFLVWQGLLNGGYKLITTVRNMIRDWRNKQN